MQKHSRDKQQEKRNQEKEAMSRRLQSQQEALEKARASSPRGNMSGERKVFRGGARGRGHPQSRGLKKHQDCFYCGAMDRCGVRRFYGSLSHTTWVPSKTPDMTWANLGGGAWDEIPDLHDPEGQDFLPAYGLRH